MKAIYLILSLATIILFASCEREKAEQFPCPPDNEKSGDYMCAEVSSEGRFISVGRKTGIGGSFGCLITGFTDFNGNPYPVWTISYTDQRVKTTTIDLEIGFKYPFISGQRMVYPQSVLNAESRQGSFYVQYYFFGQGKRYLTDSLSKGWFEINQYPDGTYFGRFEVDLGRVSNINERIKITGGKFFIANNGECLYMIKDY